MNEFSPGAGDDAVAIARILANDHVADVVEALNKEPRELASELLAELPFERTVEIFDQPELEEAPALIEALPRERAARLLAAMSADRAADVLRELAEPGRSELLHALAPSVRHSLLAILGYPEGSAGSIMTTEYVSVPPDWTVGRTLDYIRKVERTRETVYAIYVVDPQTRNMLRAFGLRRLIIGAPEDRIIDIAPDQVPVTVSPLMDVEQVAHLIRKYDLLAVPVVEDEKILGIVTVDGNSSIWRNNTALEVGVGGSGALNVVNGGLVESQSGVIGDTMKGVGTVLLDGTGSEWRMPGPLVVGWNGTGGLTVRNDASLYSGDGVIGLLAGAKGSVLVTGSGSRWESVAGLTVGRDGQGSLQIQDGGHVLSASGVIGRNASGVGVVEVDGVDSRWDVQAPGGAFLTVGEAGLGALTISNGGTVSDGSAYIGSAVGSVGVAKVTGAGSQWATRNYLYVGYEGTGDLTVADGGRIETANATIGVQASSTGQVLVHGAGSVLDASGHLEVGLLGKNAVLAVHDGGEVRSIFGTLGVLAGSVGTASVFGPNSLWANADELAVGKNGTGHLEIGSGGQVRSRFGVAGELAGSVGRVLVDGVGSSWANQDNLTVGYEGAGVVHVVHGGSLSNELAIIAHHVGSTGSVLVDGTGSTWTNRDLLVVGNEGSGELTISNGGVVSAGSTVNIATVTGSMGAINIGAAPGQAARGVEHVLAVVERLRGGVQLQRDHVAHVFHHLQHVARFVRAHRDVVLGVRAGRHRIHAGRMRARGEVVDQRGGGVLHDHEARIGRVLVADQERRQAIVVGRVDQLVQAPLGDRREHRDRSLVVTHRQR